MPVNNSTGNKIGEGTYSKVYKYNNTRAIKISQFKDMPFDMVTELVVLKRMSKSPFIVTLLDQFYIKDNFAIVMPLAKCDLSKIRNFLNIFEKRSIAFDILNGIYHLHTYNVIHRDLKHQNILYFDNGNISITDFGLSSIKGYQYSSDICTISYKAPELYNEESYDEKIDIWSFGMILYELFSNSTIIPYEKNKNQQNFLKTMNKLREFSNTPFCDNEESIIDTRVFSEEDHFLLFVLKKCFRDKYSRSSAYELLTDMSKNYHFEIINPSVPKINYRRIKLYSLF